MKSFLPQKSNQETIHERSRKRHRAGTGAFKPKKSVALSGLTAGNIALCTVGSKRNDLHYRGYDILELARACEFEEVAHLLVPEKLPTPARTDRVQSEAQGD